ncbi:ABC-2 transporter family protein [Clostridium sporogenes]|uniref:ABC-2 transporter family protein n=1 Tax=Clostridium sporogenes TaxID=1509 RepID=A0A1L3NJ13_CLOSG|nr:ABC transporter permease [Clostridium sporogenes]APH16088.1 ABC-2 transporter family protein [Clostridium sporogenes]
MKTLIRLELKKFTLRPHLIGLIIANIIILFLSVSTSSIISNGAGALPTVGSPTMQLDTTTLAAMLTRATLIVWEAVLISLFIIEEYRNKTINLLFTYPVNRAKLIFAKVILVCGIMLLFYICSSIFQNFSIFLLSRQFNFVTYGFQNLFIQVLIGISTILIGLLPLCIGMVKKSSIATIVASIILMAFTSNSQGSTAGLLSMPLVAIILGLIGATFSILMIRKMIYSDLYD